MRERPWASHPKGYYQPGVLALAKSGRVLYRWQCRPNRSNMSGAGARPEAMYTWQQIESRLDGVDSDEDAALDEQATLGANDLSWPHFLLILTAHGWFVRPKAFPLARPEDDARISPGKMMPRVYAFVAVWLAALVILPLSWVAVAFALWLVILTPGLIEIHRQFQHVPVKKP